MKNYQCVVFFAAIFWSTLAFAGKDIRGDGASPELACWNYELRANYHAGGGGAGCYASCKISEVKYDESKKIYWYRFNNPNHSGSCKSKYDRTTTYSTEEDFARAFPRPGIAKVSLTSQTPSQPRYDYQSYACNGRIGVIRPSTNQFVALHALHGPVMIRWVFQKNGRVTSTMDIQANPQQPETATAQPGGIVGFDCI